MSVGEIWGRHSRPKLDVLQSMVTSIIMEWTFPRRKVVTESPTATLAELLRADTGKFEKVASGCV